VIKLGMVILTGTLFLVGCASTSKAPKNLDGYSTYVKAAFVNYKNAGKPHKASAINCAGLLSILGI
jgi:hypothetical protein